MLFSSFPPPLPFFCFVLFCFSIYESSSSPSVHAIVGYDEGCCPSEEFPPFSWTATSVRRVRVIKGERSKFINRICLLPSFDVPNKKHFLHLGILPSVFVPLPYLYRPDGRALFCFLTGEAVNCFPGQRRFLESWFVFVSTSYAIRVCN